MPQAKTPPDTDLIRSLAELLRENDLSEIEIERKDFRIRVARSVTMSTQNLAGPTSAAPTIAASALEVTQAPAGPAEGTLTSPMVGTVYLSPSPDKPPFVTVGSPVRRGQTLLIIEAMKTFNEIQAPRDGVISAIFVEPGRPVEYGEALLVIS